MNSFEASRQLKKHKLKKIGTKYNYKGDTLTLHKVIAVPTREGLFEKYYREFVENSELWLQRLAEEDYDILFFFTDPYDQFAFYLALDDFKEAELIE